MSQTPRIVFLKTEWMEFYDGRSGDKPPGTFKYVKEHLEAHEDLNFKPQGSYYYGYAPIKGGGGRINIERLGAPVGAEYIDNVHVVWIAAKPGGLGVVVVGWYRGARLYAELQGHKQRWYYARGLVSMARRLDVDERHPRIEDPPRRSNVWYAKDRSDVISMVRRLMIGSKTRSNATHGKHDAEKCSRIELRAYAAVIRKYKALGFNVQPVWKDKVGWDLVATRDKVKLRIEVKGTEKHIVRAELTPNEYAASNSHKSYRICIVTQALSRHPEIYAFSRNFNGDWFDEGGTRQLVFDERIGARLSTTSTAAGLGSPSTRRES